jgi:hypothetical protein
MFQLVLLPRWYIPKRVSESTDLFLAKAKILILRNALIIVVRGFCFWKRLKNLDLELVCWNNPTLNIGRKDDKSPRTITKKFTLP